VTRVFKDPNSGAEIKRENFQTHYAAEPIIRCVPPAPGAPAPAGSAPAGTPGTGARRPTIRHPGHRRTRPRPAATA
jgi:hypothetical protein